MERRRWMYIHNGLAINITILFYYHATKYFVLVWNIFMSACLQLCSMCYIWQPKRSVRGVPCVRYCAIGAYLFYFQDGCDMNVPDRRVMKIGLLKVSTVSEKTFAEYTIKLLSLMVSAVSSKYNSTPLFVSFHLWFHYCVVNLCYWGPEIWGI